MKTQSPQKVIFALLMLFIFAGCGKEKGQPDAEYANRGVPADIQTRRTLTQWFDIKSANTSPDERKLLDTLQQNLDWEHCYKVVIDGKKELVLITIKDAFRTANLTRKHTEKKLAILSDEHAGIIKVNILELLPPGNEQLNVSPLTFQQLYKNEPAPFTGYYSVLSITNQPVYELEYKSGKIYSRSYNEPRSRPGNGGSKAGFTGKVQDCIDWYWVTYVDGVIVSEQYAFTTCDGTVPCRFFRDFDSDIVLKSNCGGSGSEGNGITIVSTDTVIKILQKPCFVNNVNSIQSANFKNAIVRLFNQTYVGTGHIANLKFIENGSLYNADGSVRAALSVIEPYTWVIQLNPNYDSTATKEYWGSVIIHEIVHSFLTIYSTQNPPLSQFDQHQVVFERWIDQMSDFLMQSYGISLSDARSLSLGGLDDVLKEYVGSNPVFKQKYVTMALTKYGINLSDAENTRNEYKNGTKGNICN